MFLGATDAPRREASVGRSPSNWWKKCLAIENKNRTREHQDVGA